MAHEDQVSWGRAFRAVIAGVVLVTFFAVVAFISEVLPSLQEIGQRVEEESVAQGMTRSAGRKISNNRILWCTSVHKFE
ncbi:MAG: hypothetical protein MK080_11825, partial [Opitutales bacterium]|nr:hypothetical protein [Opitutales bacterium]